MSKRVRAIAKPELITWVREDAGLSIEQAAKKISVTPERLESWERGDAHPTVRQLRLLGQACKRPLAIFFLSKPPKHFQALRDFRRLPGEVAGIETPELRAEIRKARYRREVALGLLQFLGEAPSELATSIDLSADPEEAAQTARQLLGVELETQIGWKTPHDALNAWRSALEDLGVLVLQAISVPREECRGFSISEFPLPVIVVNRKDTVRGRIFTMMHELAHLLLHRGGLCDLDEDAKRPPEEQGIEVFCNRVAGAILVPRQWLLEAPEVGRQQSPEWDDAALGALAHRFTVSREVILRRLLLSGRTTQDFYRRKRKQFAEEYQDLVQRQREKPGFGPLPHITAVGSAGPFFSRLVLDSYYQEKITASDVSDYLEVRWKHVPKIEQVVFGLAEPQPAS